MNEKHSKEKCTGRKGTKIKGMNKGRKTQERD